jgi:hypothetical protein
MQRGGENPVKFKANFGLSSIFSLAFRLAFSGHDQKRAMTECQ